MLYIIDIYIVALFSDDWLLLDEKRYIFLKSSLDHSSTLLFQFIISFTFARTGSLRKYEIKLMFFPKSHILFAEEGQPIGPIG